MRAVVYDLFARGAIPLRADVARALGLTDLEVATSYERLAAHHALVLHPASGEVRMAMPFSAIETPFRVVCRDRAWWANCAWDAFGIAAALDVDARVATSCADCGLSMIVAVDRGDVKDGDARCHIAVPAAHWWDDIAET